MARRPPTRPAEGPRRFPRDDASRLVRRPVRRSSRAGKARSASWHRRRKGRTEGSRRSHHGRTREEGIEPLRRGPEFPPAYDSLHDGTIVLGAHPLGGEVIDPAVLPLVEPLQVELQEGGDRAGDPAPSDPFEEPGIVEVLPSRNFSRECPTLFTRLEPRGFDSIHGRYPSPGTGYRLVAEG